MNWIKVRDRLPEEDDPLYLVGHLPEFHSFLAALRELKDFKEKEK